MRPIATPQIQSLSSQSFSEPKTYIKETVLNWLKLLKTVQTSLLQLAQGGCWAISFQFQLQLSTSSEGKTGKKCRELNFP